MGIYQNNDEEKKQQSGDGKYYRTIFFNFLHFVLV